MDLLAEAGPCNSGGMGLTPLSWVDIESWSRMTATDVSPFEARTLRHMSRWWASVASRPNEDCPVESDEYLMARDMERIREIRRQRAEREGTVKDDGIL